MVLDDSTNIVKLSRDNKNLEETINVLLQEKQILEGKINVCQNEIVSLKKTLQTEKEKNQKINATLIEQVKSQKNETEHLTKQCQKEKEILYKANITTTLDRKLFNYMATHLRNTPYPGAENYTRYTVARLGMLPLAGIEPLKPEYVFNNFTSFRYPISIPSCQKTAADPYGKISSNYMRNHMFINDINDFLIIFDHLIYFSLN
jgi:hypothetical protein